MKTSLKIAGVFLVGTLGTFVLAAGVTLIGNLIIHHHVRPFQPSDWIDFTVISVANTTLALVIAWWKSRRNPD